MADIFGTFGPDSNLEARLNDQVFALAGNDVLSTAYSSVVPNSGGFLIGGTGNDTYRITSRTIGFVFETGNDSGDRLEFAAPFFSNSSTQSTVFVEIDNRDLLAVRISSSGLVEETGVWITNWRAPGGIEQFQDSTGTVYGLATFQQRVLSSPSYAGSFTLDELIAQLGSEFAVLGGEDGLRQALDDVLERSLQLDNTPTLYVRDGATGQNIAWFIDNSTILQGSPLEIPVMPTQWQIEATGDFNRDGKDDLVWWNRESGETAVWFMDGTDFLGAANIAAPPLNSGWRIAGSGDLNRDNQDDLVWHNEQTGEAVVWFMNGASYAGGGSIATLGLDWSLETVGDLDGDSRDELVWRNGSTGRNVVWQMDGNRITSGADINTTLTDTNWEIRGTADFNYDGTEDLLWQHRFAGDMIVWNMQGANVIGSSSLPALPSGSWQATI